MGRPVWMIHFLYFGLGCVFSAVYFFLGGDAACRESHGMVCKWWVWIYVVDLCRHHGMQVLMKLIVQFTAATEMALADCIITLGFTA